MRLVRDLLFDAMKAEGIPYLFGNPGTTELPIVQGCAEQGIEYVLSLHEDVAVGMAMGYAHATGKAGVVNLHVAPGLAHGLGNLYNAYKAGLPLVITAGQHHTEVLIQEPILAGDLVEMAKPFCKWAYQVNRPEEFPLALHRAFKVAQTHPQGPVFLALPPDVMLAETDLTMPPPSRIETRTSTDTAALTKAAELLRDARNPLIVVGDVVGRSGAHAEVAALAELMGAPVLSEPLSVWLNFPTDHPHFIGGMPGGNMTVARRMLEGYDLLLLVGFCSQAAVAVHDGNGPLLPQNVPTIYVHEDVWEIAKNGPAEIGILGDVKRIMADMVTVVKEMDLSHARLQERRQQTLAKASARRESLNAAAAAVEGKTPLHPIAVMRALGPLLQEPHAIVNEAISNTAVVNDHLPLRQPEHLVGVKGGGLGHSMPAALGVAMARPGAQIVSIVGDGTALYYPQALWTAAHYQLPVTFLVLNNSNYRILKIGLTGMGGPWGADKRTAPGLDITNPDIDWVALAQGFGVEARRIETPAELEESLRWALERKAPVLLDVVINEDA